MEDLNLMELLEVVRKDDDNYESVNNPAAMGNAQAIAYGGCALGFGVKAAYATVGEQYHLYTVMGSYLGPATTDRKLRCAVARVRDTRTFATRKLEIFQKQDDGKDRMVMYMLADFQVREKASLMTYAAPPFHGRPSLDQCLTIEQRNEQMMKNSPGTLTKEMTVIWDKLFGLARRSMDWRVVPDGVFSQNMSGMLAKAKTTQDHLPLTDRTSSDWLKHKAMLKSPGQHVAALSFIMDGAVSFLPLSHDGKFLYDAGACSSLDFSLRFFSNDIDINKWHFRELRTINAAEGRSYSESRIWNEAGAMVAVMTQQAILRPKEKKEKKKTTKL